MHERSGEDSEKERPGGTAAQYRAGSPCAVFAPLLEVLLTCPGSLSRISARPSTNTGIVKAKADKLVCWQCGGSLASVRRPIRHGTRCPTCRADLHVCRQCRHHAPKVRGECDHDRADRVIDKTSANYCTYFRPARGVWRDDADASRNRARGELSELFGLAPEPNESAAEKSVKSVANARRDLDALFDFEPEVDPGSTAADSEDRER